jgi:hypothetical protein
MYDKHGMILRIEITLKDLEKIAAVVRDGERSLRGFNPKFQSGDGETRNPRKRVGADAKKVA